MQRNSKGPTRNHGHKRRRFDLAILEEWAIRAGGTVAKAQAECPGLSNHKRKYVLGLLERLATMGRIPAGDAGRQIGQYASFYNFKENQ
jgi:hypothetical protein